MIRTSVRSLTAPSIRCRLVSISTLPPSSVQSRSPPRCRKTVPVSIPLMTRGLNRWVACLTTSQASSLRCWQRWTRRRDAGHDYAGRDSLKRTAGDSQCAVHRATGPSERAGWLFWADQDCGRIPTFLGLTCGLIRIGSGAAAVGCRASAQARPDPTERV
jgi:hypothetical protein